MATLLHREPFGGDLVKMILSANPRDDGVGYAATTTGDIAEVVGVGAFRFLGGAATNWMAIRSLDVITDPGNAGAIPVTNSGTCLLESAGAETRTMAIPPALGLDREITLQCSVYVGDIVVTVASAIDTTTNTIMTFGNVGDFVILRATDTGGTLEWRVVNHGGGVAFT